MQNIHIIFTDISNVFENGVDSSIFKFFSHGLYLVVYSNARIKLLSLKYKKLFNSKMIGLYYNAFVSHAYKKILQ